METRDRAGRPGRASLRRASLVAMTAALAAALAHEAQGEPIPSPVPVSGTSLRWLPYRSSLASEAAPAVSRPAAPSAGVRHASTNPFDDPFGDNESGVHRAMPLVMMEQDSAPPVADPPPEAPRTTTGPPTPGRLPGAAPRERIRRDRLGDEPINVLKPRCLPPYELIKRSSELTNDTSVARGKPELIEAAKQIKTMWCPLPEAYHPNRITSAWAPTTFTWKSSSLCHKPLYFEQVHAERFGHTTGPLSQPLVSAGHFFLTVPVLPYKMGLYPPYECMYTLGYYRPGSCAPYYLDPLPLSVRAGLAEAGAWLGAIYIIP